MKSFTFTVWYFRASGKFYASATVEHEVNCAGPGPYMADFVDWIKGLRDRRQAMPGLSGIWNGAIVVNCEEGYPVLIPGTTEE